MNDAPPSGDTQRSKPAGIDWLATTAGALAAVTSALLLSTLGAVGTLVGAAIGSVAATVGTNLYSQWLAKSHEKVANVQALAKWRSAGLAGVRNDSDLASEEDEDPAAEEAGPTLSWRERLGALPWKRIALVSLAMFVVVIAAITVFELLAGRSVSSIVGGGDGRTTISRMTGGGSSTGDEGRSDDPSSGATATPDESASASTEPSEDAEPAEPSGSAATEEPSSEPSASTGSSTSPTTEPSERSGSSSEASPSTGASPAAEGQTTP